jgi:CrcB protein
MDVLWVGVGGAAGAIARYLVSGLVQDRAGGLFPWGTLVVNVTGCLAMGLLAGLADARGFMTPATRALLVVGVLGGFTTFSAFGNETMNLLVDRDLLRAAANVGLNVVLGLGAVWAGRAGAFLVWR